MKCEQCDNCIEDYSGNPYCFAGSCGLSDEDMEEDNVELYCIDFQPKEGEP